jgi:hypothetical protein
MNLETLLSYSLFLAEMPRRGCFALGGKAGLGDLGELLLDLGEA